MTSGAWFAVQCLDYLACALLALAAAFRGGRHGLPFTGAVILGMACALAVPLVRTLMIMGSAPILLRPDAFDERGYLAASFAGACTGLLLQRRLAEKTWLFPALEAVSLALATALGTHVAHRALAIGPAAPVMGILIGCAAGTVGGVLRDLCLTERPALLEADFYGSAVAVGAMAGAGLYALQAGFGVQVFVGSLCVFGLRIFGSLRMRRRGLVSEF
jgi:uncharacterized membrane protein YeiH